MNSRRRAVQQMSVENQQGASSRRSSGAVAMSADFSVIRAVVACLTWSVVSSSIIFLNKYIMAGPDGANGFPFPMALSCIGMTTSSIGSYIAVVRLKLVPQTIEITPRFWFGRALPIGVCGALTLYFGNLAYLYISVSYIQMLKGMTPIITLVVGILFGIDAATLPLCGSLLVIALGVFMSSYAEAEFVLAGFLAMLAAETAEAGKVVLMQKLMAGNKLHVLEGLLCFAPPCALSLFVGMLLIEYEGMANEGVQRMLDNPFLFLLQGCMGFVVNLLILLVIKTTSSVTFKVVSMMKNVAVVVGSVPLFGNVITSLQAVGYALSICGFCAYQYARSLQGPIAVVSSRKDRQAYAMPNENGDSDEEQQPLQHTDTAVRAGSCSALGSITART